MCLSDWSNFLRRDIDKHSGTKIIQKTKKAQLKKAKKERIHQHQNTQRIINRIFGMLYHAGIFSTNYRSRDRN